MHTPPQRGCACFIVFQHSDRDRLFGVIQRLIQRLFHFQRFLNFNIHNLAVLHGDDTLFFAFHEGMYRIATHLGGYNTVPGCGRAAPLDME